MVHKRSLNMTMMMVLLLFFSCFGQEEKQGRVCALIHGSGQLISDSADALGINNSFRTLVIFISVRSSQCPI